MENRQNANFFKVHKNRLYLPLRFYMCDSIQA